MGLPWLRVAFHRRYYAVVASSKGNRNKHSSDQDVAARAHLGKTLQPDRMESNGWYCACCSFQQRTRHGAHATFNPAPPRNPLWIFWIRRMINRSLFALPASYRRLSMLSCDHQHGAVSAVDEDGGKRGAKRLAHLPNSRRLQGNVQVSF